MINSIIECIKKHPSIYPISNHVKYPIRRFTPNLKKTHNNQLKSDTQKSIEIYKTTQKSIDKIIGPKATYTINKTINALDILNAIDKIHTKNTKTLNMYNKYIVYKYIPSLQTIDETTCYL